MRPLPATDPFDQNQRERERQLSAEVGQDRLTIIEPRQKRRISERIAELSAFRELFLLLVWRDVKVKYKQTAFGVIWVIAQPLLAAGMFALIFSRVEQFGGATENYALFAFAGMVLWTYFAAALSHGSDSLVSGSSLITKVYFPRIIMPAAAVASPLLDLCISTGLLMVFAIGTGSTPLWRIPLSIAGISLAAFAAFGSATWLSAINSRYRDVRYVLPFMTQVWLFATPIVYPLQLIPKEWRFVAALNPMTGASEIFRWAMLNQPVVLYHIVISVLAALTIAISGLLYFGKVQRTFADII